MIAFRSKAVSKLETAATSLDVAVPAGVQAGDVLLCWMYLTAQTITITPPAGWNLGRQLGVFNASLAVFWRLADGTEPGTYPFTLSTSQRVVATVAAYSGASPTTPLGNLWGTNPGGLATVLALPGRTAAVDNSWLLTTAGARRGSDPGVSFTIDEATDAERSDDTTTGGTSGGRPSLAVYDSAGAVARGSVNDRVVTASDVTSNSTLVGWLTDLISDETTGTGPIAFRGAASGHYDGFAATVNIDLDASYVQDGDLLVVVMTRNGGTLTPPAGFTRVQFIPTGGVEYSLWYKIASSEPATLTFVSAGSTRFHTVGMVAYSGANTSSPIGAWAFNQDVGTSTPTITTRTSGSWIFSAIFKNSSVASFDNADPLDAERVEQVAASYPLAMYDSAREYAAASDVARTLTSPSGGAGYLRLIAEIRPGTFAPTGPTVTLNYRETPGAWTQYTAVPKVWTAGGWVEAPGRYWDGTAYQDLPS